MAKPSTSSALSPLSRWGWVLLLAACSHAAAALSWEETLAIRRQWWSLQPIQISAPPTSPAVIGQQWSSHPVDRFLLAGMESANLTPAADAPAAVVCRRLHFLLTGLPPSPAENAEFAAAYQADPAKAVADSAARLMAVPAFGETWARHWMDLVRYAETHGSEGDPDIPSAWRYRDYLIRALNQDVPVDQLIREHIAGDLLPQPRWNDADQLNESMLGTAQLRMVEHGFQPVDSLDEQVRTVDSQIDVLSKAFQGLTISCARCHDHKFDAVSQRDYYALYGIMASSRPGQITVDSPDLLHQHDAGLTKLRNQIHHDLQTAWLKTADEIPSILLARQERQKRLAETKSILATLTDKISVIESAARSKARRQRNQSASTGHVTTQAQPWARWEFDTDARDTLGHASGKLSGGAKIENGRLILDGSAAVMTSAPLPESITEKTLEAWVSVAHSDQSGGGVISVEKNEGAVFDAIVFAEHEPRQWRAGSEFGSRSQPRPDSTEDSPPDKLVHLACVYDACGGIRLYRNGAPCGPAYGSTGPVTFPAGDSRILIGQRHTGGGRAFFAGSVEEARLYIRALTPEEIATSFQAGADAVPEAEWLAVLTNDSRAELLELRQQKGAADQVWKDLSTGIGKAWDNALRDAVTDTSSPLHPWAAVQEKSDQELPSTVAALRGALTGAGKEFQEFVSRWKAQEIGDSSDARWRGFGADPTIKPTGSFTILPEGEKILTGLNPSGRLSGTVSTRQNAVMISPRFPLDDSLAIRAWGGGNARVRVIVDQYPLGNNDTYPQAALDNSGVKWIRFDTTYRKGSWAYLEFTTDGDGMIQGSNTGKRNSWFGVQSALTYSGKEIPPEPHDDALTLLHDPLPDSLSSLASRVGGKLRQILSAPILTDSDTRFLDFFIRRGLLPASLPDNSPLAQFRALEASLPEPRRAPGLLEAEGFDTALMTRGDPRKPAESVPRGYLEVLGGMKITTHGSGRFQLADAIASPDNPLTSRVMVNRLWQEVFGRGLVATPDDFGKMGTPPTHPELLDFLASRFLSDGWSTKKMLTFLITTRAFRESSAASEPATVRDPDNSLLSHATVRRLDAEAIRDSLLAIGGVLKPDAGGPGEEAATAPENQTRRSVYLTIRRTRLPAFLHVFDQPVPFSTAGHRAVTTVPAQSLAMMNDPFVLHCAQTAANRDLRENPETPPPDRVSRLFETLLGRPPLPEELRDCLTFLTSSDSPPDAAAWTELVQSLLNAKEFLYLL